MFLSRDGARAAWLWREGGVVTGVRGEGLLRPEAKTKLRRLAEQRALTLTDIAALAHLSYARVRRMATNASNVPLAQAMLVSRVLGLPLEDVFTLSTDSPASRVDHSEA